MMWIPTMVLALTTLVVDSARRDGAFQITRRNRRIGLATVAALALATAIAAQEAMVQTLAWLP